MLSYQSGAGFQTAAEYIIYKSSWLISKAVVINFQGFFNFPTGVGFRFHQFLCQFRKDINIRAR